MYELDSEENWNLIFRQMDSTYPDGGFWPAGVIRHNPSDSQCVFGGASEFRTESLWRTRPISGGEAYRFVRQADNFILLSIIKVARDR